MIHGVIFDLDGTLVESALDFDAMRREMRIEPGHPILEAIGVFDEARASECRAILDRHEQAGAERAHVMPGAREFVDDLAAAGIRRAVFTRNSRAIAEYTLGRLSLAIDTIVAREDAPAKPDPTGIWNICQVWDLSTAEVIAIGDYRFDLEAAQRAGVRSVWYNPPSLSAPHDFSGLADFTIASFHAAAELLRDLNRGPAS